MGSLGDLVGDLVDLDPPLNVNPGTVLLTFRHGGPVDVIKPGKKLRRGRGLPLTMAPQGVPISTADTPIDVAVNGIALPGPFNLPSLRARVVIRVDDRDGYEGLIAYVRNKGLNFADMLDGEVENELDQLLRRSFGQYDHRSLYERGHLSDLVDLSGPLLDGLFRIESIQKVEPIWHPEFERAREAAAEKAREAAELLLEHEALDLYRQIQEDEDLLLAEKAARRNMSLAQYENPELVEASLQRQHELQLAIIENSDALRRVGNQDAIANAMRMAGGLDPSASTPAGGLTAGGPDVGTGWSASTEPLERLRRDATLLRMWRKAGLPGEPAGVGLGENTILAVCAGPADDSVRRGLQDRVAQQVDAREVITIDEAGNIEDVVRKYFVTRVPELAGDDVSMTISKSGERLVVDLASERQRLSPLLNRIKDPDADVLAPLESVLPYEAIDVTVGGQG